MHWKIEQDVFCIFFAYAGILSKGLLLGNCSRKLRCWWGKKLYISYLSVNKVL